MHLDFGPLFPPPLALNHLLRGPPGLGLRPKLVLKQSEEKKYRISSVLLITHPPKVKTYKRHLSYQDPYHPPYQQPLTDQHLLTKFYHMGFFPYSSIIHLDIYHLDLLASSDCWYNTWTVTKWKQSAYLCSNIPAS